MSTERGIKHDENKIDCSLLLMFGKALRAVAEVGAFGAEKYTRDGWEYVPSGQERYTAAMLRHVFEENYGLYDKGEGGSGLLHSAHVAWNALARLELELRSEGSLPTIEDLRLAQYSKGPTQL